MARASTLLLLALLCGPACGPESSTQVLDARIVTADGANPLSTGDYDRLRISWAQVGYETATQEIDLSGDDFEVPFELDLVASARIRVELSGPSGTVHGAPPFFPPLAAFPLVRIVVGEPGTCAVVDRFDAPEPARADSGYVHLAGFLVQFGGVADSGPTSDVTFSDLYWAESGAPLNALPERAGRTKASLLGRSEADQRVFALVVSEGGIWRYQLNGQADGEIAELQPLHSTAGIGSALARNADGVVLVAGGGDEDEPSRELARIATDGRVTLGGLLGARVDAGAGAAGDEAMVVAGGSRAAGAPFVEWVSLSTLGSTRVDEPTAASIRREPLVLEGQSSHWIVGGTDDAGAPLTSSWVLSGCPESCVLEPGPEVDLGTAPRADGLTLTDGLTVYTAVEEGGWRLEPVADLAQERLAAGITVYESGMVFVHGGRGADGPRLDGELCFPAELTPLD